jgi:YidC/Oxa1 family membrane protein insertase
MDKQSITGLILIFGILVLFWWINAPNEEQQRKWQQYHDSVRRAELAYNDSIARQQAQQPVKPAPADSAATDSTAQFGELANAVNGTNQFYTIENNLIKLTISSQGGRIYSAELKEYKTFQKTPLILFDGDQNRFGFPFNHNNRVYHTNDLFFKAVNPTSDGIEMVVEAGQGRLVYTYKLHNDSYMVDFAIKSENLNNIFAINTPTIDLEWKMKMPVQEKGRSMELQNSGVYYRFHQSDVDWLNASKQTQEDIRTKLDWIAFKDQFFSSILIAKTPFAGASIASAPYMEETHTTLRDVEARMGIPFDFKQHQNAEFNFFFGPNYFYTLNQYKDLELTELIPLGWGIFGWINRIVVIPVFKFLEGFIGNYGLIILILTILIKLVLFPFTYKSYLSSAKMKVLKPEIDEINNRIPKEKAMERQQATMALYKKAGVNPMGGCLPMLLQMPILFAMFKFFPASIELRHESFLWADDLSAYDSILNLPFTIPLYGDHISLFCLLMAAANIISTWMNTEMTNTNSQMPGMKTMMYMMPVMFLVFFNNYASGLSYYYFVSTVITIGQTLVIRRFVDEDAIRLQIKANQKKPVKKSKFAQRLEEMARQQQQLQQQQKMKKK